MVRVKLLFCIIVYLFMVSCNRSSPIAEQGYNFLSISDVSQSKWQKLSTAKVYFGHNSVGFNIVDGIDEVLRSNPQIQLNVVQGRDPSTFSGPAFLHGKIGKNKRPETKLEDFVNLVESGMSGADVAFFKLCWVDITSETNIDKLFETYKRSMAQLKEQYPETHFVHVTVPYTSEGVGFHLWVKKIKDVMKGVIGRTNYYDNYKRNLFNEKMLAEYVGKETVFDLAKLESSCQNGRRESFAEKGRVCYSLCEGYTDDYAHLNKVGSRIAAEQLLILLANVIE